MAPPSTLLLREHDATAIGSIPPKDVEAILNSGARLTWEAHPGGPPHVRAAEVVGTFLAGSTRVTITPKVPIRRLLFLLGFLERLPKLTGPVSLTPDVDLLEAMQHLFATALDRALAAGLIHAYEEFHRPLVGVRGRIDVAGLAIRRFGLVPPLDCTFDEYTADTEANRRLLAACALLARVSRPGSGVSARLRGLAARMEEVSPIVYDPATIQPLRVDRRFDRYGPALSLAELVLRFGSLELKDGHTKSVGFLVDMNVVYEDFVAEGLRRALDEPPSRWHRHPSAFHLAEGRRVPIFPDIVWFGTNGQPKLVLDVKYKDTSEPKREDLYQLVAYCQSLGLKRGVLVYPTLDEQRLVVTNDGPTIDVLRLDPNGDPSDLQARLAALAGRLRILAS